MRRRDLYAHWENSRGAPRPQHCSYVSTYAKLDIGSHVRMTLKQQTGLVLAPD